MNRLQGFIGQFTVECLETFALVGYDWFVVAGVIGLVLWIFGSERGKKMATLSPVIYIILQILSKVLCHV